MLLKYNLIRTEDMHRLSKLRGKLGKLREWFMGTPEFSPEQKERLLNQLVDNISDYGMEAPALMFLGEIRPLSRIGGQMLWAFGSPFFDSLGLKIFSDYAWVLQNRQNIDRLLNMIEERTKSEKKKKYVNTDLAGAFKV